MHTLPGAIDYQEEVAFDRFPIAPFFAIISFLGFFFLQKVLAPALKLGHGGPSDAHVCNFTHPPDFDGMCGDEALLHHNMWSPLRSVVREEL